MKKYTVLLGAAFLFVFVSEKSICQVTNPGTVVQNNASNQANSNVNNSVNNGLNTVTTGLTGMFKKKEKLTQADSVQMMQSQGAQQPANPNNPSNPNTGSPAMTNTGQTQGSFQSLSSYQNYDFVPGNNILFEDEFTDDQSGEFPTHWDLKSGQAVLNMLGTDKAFFLTDGNYCKVQPLMKNEAYLTKNFSVEYDLYANGGYAPIIFIQDANNGGHLSIQA
jgi:OmpA-OmpF porin, OOP family